MESNNSRALLAMKVKQPKKTTLDTSTESGQEAHLETASNTLTASQALLGKLQETEDDSTN